MRKRANEKNPKEEENKKNTQGFQNQKKKNAMQPKDVSNLMSTIVKSKELDTNIFRTLDYSNWRQK